MKTYKDFLEFKNRTAEINKKALIDKKEKEQKLCEEICLDLSDPKVIEQYKLTKEKLKSLILESPMKHTYKIIVSKDKPLTLAINELLRLDGFKTIDDTHLISEYVTDSDESEEDMGFCVFDVSAAPSMTFVGYSIEIYFGEKSESKEDMGYDIFN